jgi:hypothetical protein
VLAACFASLVRKANTTIYMQNYRTFLNEIVILACTIGDLLAVRCRRASQASFRQHSSSLCATRRSVVFQPSFWSYPFLCLQYWRQDLDFELTRMHLLWFGLISIFDTLGAFWVRLQRPSDLERYQACS